MKTVFIYEKSTVRRGEKRGGEKRGITGLSF